eukprot:m.147569 g.147569  ORF g.147569 m.147569 type:complete len:356 (+) comp16264_c0_seq3:189-1256(+)
MTLMRSLASIFTLIALSTPVPHASAPFSEFSKHDYIFVVGQHHSGTTITALVLCQHSNVSCIQGSRAPENEGQHLQHVYAPARTLGGMQSYGFNSNAHLTEEDERFGQTDVPKKLFTSWSRFWDISKGYLLEKSPRHVTMTRFLQRAFGEERSKFVMIMRHPLGAGHYFWNKRRNRGWIKDSCGRKVIEHWLAVHNTFERDVGHLHSVTGLHFEEYLSRSRHLAQVITNRLFGHLGLEQSVQLEFQESAHAYNDQHEIEVHADHLSEHQQSQGRRRLLEYHGDRSHVQVRYGGVYTWVDDWNKLTNNMTSPVCQALIKEKEAQLRLYGYSLQDLRWLGPATPFTNFFLNPDDLSN